MGNIPLIKYADRDGSMSLCSINESAQRNREKLLCRSRQRHQISWLIDWNKEFGFVGNRFFLPKCTQEAIHSFPKQEDILQWLTDEVKVATVNVHDYAVAVTNHFNSNRKKAIAYACFLHQSFLQGYLPKNQVDSLCGKMPLVDSYGHVTTVRSGVLVPANGSKWVELIGYNTWNKKNYIELGEDYLHPACFAGTCKSGKQFMEFLSTHVKAADIPHISPPKAGIPTTCLYVVMHHHYPTTLSGTT
jgi:sacsin